MTSKDMNSLNFDIGDTYYPGSDKEKDAPPNPIASISEELEGGDRGKQETTVIDEGNATYAALERLNKDFGSLTNLKTGPEGDYEGELAIPIFLDAIAEQ